MSKTSLQAKNSGTFTIPDKDVDFDLQRVRHFALTSRAIVLLLQIVSNNLIPDHEPDVFNPPSTANSTIGDDFVERLFGGFRRWDAIYFLFIAEHGYPYQNCLAFFPLYPLLVRISASVVSVLTFGVINLRSVLLISGFVLNNVCFVLAVESLYNWCRIVDKGRLRAWAFNAAVLFCFNPASIFFSSCYSESLFAYLTFTGLLHLETALTKAQGILGKLKSVIYFAFSGSVRSNGVINLGFIGYHQLREMYNGPRNSRFLLRKIVESLIFAVVGLLPFLLFQLFAFRLYCYAFDQDLPDAIAEYGTTREYNFLHRNRSVSEWCTRTLPLSYSYIQEQHWNVGFFRYYEWKQIPNFVLAAPILALSVWILKDLWRTRKVQAVFPYFVHLEFLIVVNLFFVHIQVSTRMLCSATPLMYCYLGRVFLPLKSQGLMDLYDEVKFRASSPVQKAVVIYFVSYFIFGIAVHSNFLPWT
ncbi:GPI mannosyltransferase 2-like [Paramacrobiotus metropolitanus]|uniref:GPI mannosyltransferase 2-like n=1 Tax=Paramacrobiotus metropolitanus TaxID=2943436 RepID=UPI0024459B73|nr:GPI mannosyltransferase 2-like [Paramacrobiotus metropolitanus]